MSGIALLGVGVVVAALALRWSHVAARGEHRIALIATLGVLAAVYNVVIPVPNVEATTMVVVAASLVLGAQFGASVGLVAIIGTSSVSSVGIWTLWQLVATCAIAIAAGSVGVLLRTRAARGESVRWNRLGTRLSAIAVVALSTVAYDLFTTWTSLSTFGGLQQNFATALLAGIPFFIVHVVATTALAALVVVALLEALERVRPRLDGGRVVT